MTFEIVSVLCGGMGPEFPQPIHQGHKGLDGVFTVDNRDNHLSPCQAYQKLLDQSESDITVFVHDDVKVNDPDWLAIVMAQFNHVNTVAVGLGGATSLGRPNLYKVPYDIRNMARGGYASNQEDAEVHGERFTGVRQVAVLDAFFMAVRTKWLRSIGGWPVDHLRHHCLDLWLACEAARWDKEIWMVGASCNHYGGRSSTLPVYGQARWLLGGTLETDHQLPHKWLADKYVDVLPLEVGK